MVRHTLYGRARAFIDHQTMERMHFLRQAGISRRYENAELYLLKRQELKVRIKAENSLRNFSNPQ